jgi:hypothetical protein
LSGSRADYKISTLNTIRRALEGAGVEFIDEGLEHASGSAPMHPNGAPAPRQTSEPPTESALGAALRRAQEKNSG